MNSNKHQTEAYGVFFEAATNAPLLPDDMPERSRRLRDLGLLSAGVAAGVLLTGAFVESVTYDQPPKPPAHTVTSNLKPAILDSSSTPPAPQNHTVVLRAR